MVNVGLKNLHQPLSYIPLTTCRLHTLSPPTKVYCFNTPYYRSECTVDESILDEEDQPMEGPATASLDQFLDDNQEIFELKQDESDPLLAPMAELCVGQNPNGDIELVAAKHTEAPPDQQQQLNPPGQQLLPPPGQQQLPPSGQQQLLPSGNFHNKRRRSPITTTIHEVGEGSN